MPHADDDDLLATVQAMVETQQQMLRRQLATEQVFRDLRDKVAQAIDVASDVKVSKYQHEQSAKQIEQLFAVVRSQSGRIFLLYITILIILVVLGVPIAILLFR